MDKSSDYLIQSYIHWESSVKHSILTKIFMFLIHKYELYKKEPILNSLLSNKKKKKTNPIQIK